MFLCLRAALTHYQPSIHCTYISPALAAVPHSVDTAADRHTVMADTLSCRLFLPCTDEKARTCDWCVAAYLSNQVRARHQLAQGAVELSISAI